MNNELEMATNALNEFLEEHPELEEYQNMIDESLDGVENSYDRLSIIIGMLVENNNRLLRVLEDFKG